MELTEFNLNDVISEVAELYHHELSLALELSLETLPPVKADAGRMRQVFHNLIRNALEAMDYSDDQQLKISTHHTHDEGMGFIEIKVEDNGPGFRRNC